MGIIVNENNEITKLVVEEKYGKDGKSAFEVWQDSNPGGTLEQYNAFIKGEKGDPGSDATVTQENIESALPYTIAKKQEVLNYVNVIYFGNDTAAVQDAIDFAVSSGNLKVYIPSDVTYDISLLTIPSNLHIFDEGLNTVIFSNMQIGQSVSAGGKHLLFRSYQDGALRMHLEPKGTTEINETRCKLDLMIDPYEDNQDNYRIINLYTKTDNDLGNNGVTVINTKGKGADNYGIFPAMHFSAQDDDYLFFKCLFFDTSDTEWRTTFKGAWRQGISVSIGDYVIANYKLYKANSTGITGVIKPSHFSGVVSDGAINWEFTRDYQANSGNLKPVTLFGDRVDMPVYNFPDVIAQFAKDILFFNGKKQIFIDQNNSKVLEVGTKSNTGDIYTDTYVNGSKEGYYRLSPSGQFKQSVGLSYMTEGKIVTTSGVDQNIDFTACEMVNLAPTTDSSYTTVTASRYQRAILLASNNNITLKSSPNLKLPGNKDIKLSQGEAIQFVFNASGTVGYCVGGYSTVRLDKDNNFPVKQTFSDISVGTGASGSYTTADGKTVTVTDGIITSIV